MDFIAKASSKIDRIVDRTQEGFEHAKQSVIGLYNPNHRHDDPWEIEADEIRSEICKQHRFYSFAGERHDCFVKWHIDGHDYMWALSEMLDSAKEAIFIMDWWLTPELYLRRPPAHYPEWRLDLILKRKAEEGVKIYVIVYKEVTQTMSMSSKHTKHALEDLHPNIACIRHPDHIGAKDMTEFWSHHEKVVVVDNHAACIGGLDLCFGRWDTNTHPLADVHATDFSKTLWPGQDYNNARVMDFQDVGNYVSNAVSILETARMPWHDIHMSFAGPVVLDVVQHFVERWNEIRKRKYKQDARYPLLALPHNVNVAPNEAVARHPHRERWAEYGKQFRQRFQLEHGDTVEAPYPGMPLGKCRVQVVRSVSDWSHGVLKEHSIQTAYIQLIREANHFIYIENQFFISNTQTDGQVRNLIARALVSRIIQAHTSKTKFKVVVLIPEFPGFPGDVKNETAIKTIMAGQYRTINRGGHSIYEELKKVDIVPEDYIRFYHLRAYDRINAPMATFIEKAEEEAGVKFHEAQVAHARSWIGDGDLDNIPDVLIQQPVETQEGISISDATAQKQERVKVPANADEAKEVVRKFENGAKSLRGDQAVSDSVAQHMLQDNTSLLDEKWLGTDEEERNSYVTEVLYIHAKLMIVDDRRVIMGSANLNDRSQNGDGDSEIALVVEDDDLVHSHMDGKPYMASRFATTLRRRLYQEHLGRLPAQRCENANEAVTSFMRPPPVLNEDEFSEPALADDMVEDPLAEKTINLWNETATNNRNIFTEVFRPVPSNLVESWAAYENYKPKVKIGHVVPEIPLARIKERLALVRGALVDCPLNFLISETDLVENADWNGLNPTLPIYI